MRAVTAANVATARAEGGTRARRGRGAVRVEGGKIAATTTTAKTTRRGATTASASKRGNGATQREIVTLGVFLAWCAYAKRVKDGKRERRGEGGRRARRDKSTATRDATASAGTRACLLYTSPSPRDLSTSRMPSSA